MEWRSKQSIIIIKYLSEISDRIGRIGHVNCLKTETKKRFSHRLIHSLTYYRYNSQIFRWLSYPITPNHAITALSHFSSSLVFHNIRANSIEFHGSDFFSELTTFLPSLFCAPQMLHNLIDLKIHDP
jgi:hypothetical protein